MTDIYPTLLELAQLPVPVRVNGVEQKPLEGHSFARTLTEPVAGTARTRQCLSAKKALPRGNAAACAPTSCRKKKRLPDVELQRSKMHSSGGLKLGEMVERGT